MNAVGQQVVELIFGRWRSQILYAGAELGIFDHLAPGETKGAETIAAEIDADPALLYRLLRALAALGLLVEDRAHRFSISETGKLLRCDHPQSLKYMALLEEGPEHYALWRHLPEMVRDGRQNAFVREFGVLAFEYARRNTRYGPVFNQAMTSYSTMDNALILEALRDCDLSSISTLCDVGGGHGHLLCALLNAYPHLSGLILELPEVISDSSQQWATKLGLEARCTHVAGDMFERVPTADAYILKRILHDWNDEECVQILSTMRTTALGEGRVFIIEQVVPGPETPHFAKLFDIHMMCWGTGRERTEGEYARLLEAAGWKYAKPWYPSNRLLGIVEGVGA
jgi:O-methyltransferase domain/Dimerisation domain